MNTGSRTEKILRTQTTDIKPAYFGFFMHLGIMAIVGKRNIYINGEENIPLPERSVIVAPTHHRPVSDVLVTGYAVRKHKHINFIAKEELAEIPLLGRLIFKKLGAISVNRENPKSDTLRKSLYVLDNGGWLGIFPQGTSDTSGEISEIKSGPAKIAVRKNALILPMSLITDPRSSRLRPDVHINIGTVLDPRSEQYMSLSRQGKEESLNSQLREDLINLQRETLQAIPTY